MAGEDDDIGLSLPQPPPPGPARRDAAIQEAMRRFDARGEPSRAAPTRPEPQRVGSWWGKVNRPQLGIPVAASLVAVIGLPLAWLTVSQKTTPATEFASRDVADLKTFDVEGAAPPSVSAAAPKPPAVVFEPSHATPAPVATAQDSEDRSIEAAAPPAQAFTTGKAEAPQILAESGSKRADNAGEGRRGTELAQAELRASPIMVAPAAPAAVPPPPPSIGAEVPTTVDARQDLASADTKDVIVTAARRRGRAVPDRGDWNACTINDPKRRLAACKSLVNPGAKGSKGQAAAHLADGLSLAWQGNIGRAIAAFDQAIAINPRSSLAYLNRGLAYQRQGDSDRALADLDQAIRLAPSAARGYYNRSLLFRERGDARRASADQARAINLNADYEAVVD